MVLSAQRGLVIKNKKEGRSQGTQRLPGRGAVCIRSWGEERGQRHTFGEWGEEMGFKDIRNE